MKTTITNMCMIIDKEKNKVLVQKRIKNWKGFSFPGGHIEDGEGIVESVIREVKEETGLSISDVEQCGMIHFYNEDTKERYFVFNFRTDKYHGELINETEEGEVFWVDIEELPKMEFSYGLKERIPMFLDKKYFEGFIKHNEKKRELQWF